MKLFQTIDIDSVTGLLCRESPLRGAIGGLIVCAALIGNVLLWRHAEAPAAVWILCALMAALLIPVFVWDMVAKFRSTNWLLWISPDGLWVNLRSYQNRHLPNGVTVLHLPYDEIACVHRHVETWSTPNFRQPVGITLNAAPNLSFGIGAAPKAVNYRDTRWKEKSLVLRLVSGDTREIAQALTNERRRKAGFKGTSQSVTVPAPGVIRIAWRGHSSDVVPGLARVLDAMSEYVKVAEPTRTDFPHWQQLNEAQLDTLVAQLIRSGDPLEAGRLLKCCRGCSDTEAHKLVEDLNARV